MKKLTDFLELESVIRRLKANYGSRKFVGHRLMDEGPIDSTARASLFFIPPRDFFNLPGDFLNPEAAINSIKGGNKQS